MKGKKLGLMIGTITFIFSCALNQIQSTLQIATQKLKKNKKYKKLPKYNYSFKKNYSFYT